VLGLVFIIVMIFAPEGIVGTIIRAQHAWRKERSLRTKGK